MNDRERVADTTQPKDNLARCATDGYRRIHALAEAAQLIQDGGSAPTRERAQEIVADILGVIEMMALIGAANWERQVAA
jgi:hypothetical protein